MKTTKIFFLLSFFISILFASNEADITYIDNLDSSEKSIKEEFFTKDSKKYTIIIATLKTKEVDPLEFFKKYKMKRALAYKYREKKHLFKVISGVYSSESQARDAIKSLDKRVQENLPYVAQIVRHQKLFNKFQNTINIKEDKKLEPKIAINHNKNIFTTEEKDALLLKKEFLTKGSNYYTIALGTVDLNRSSIKNFFESYDVGDRALAHVYGKNRDKARIIYGLYKTRAEAQEALNNFNKRLKSNSPFSMRMKKFQSFYNKHNSQTNEPIIKLKMNDNIEKEKKVVPKLDENIKVVKKTETKVQKPLKVEKAKTIKPKTKAPKKEKKEAKKTPIKKVIKKKKIDPNKERFVKFSSLEDVYYLEADGDFNILNEVFLKEGSSFYTVDLGELKLDEVSIEEFFVKNDMDTSALAYKYGDNKEYARAIYGAYETEAEAKKSAEELSLKIKDEIRVSNIKNHQKLYKLYHKNAFSKKTISQKNSKSLDAKILYTEDSKNKNLLLEEFFNRDSNKYTISLITYEVGTLSLESYVSRYKLRNNTLIYPMGELKSYQRIILGLYNSFNEAKMAIEELPYDLKKNSPYISKISTNQRKFESYYNRKLEDFSSNIEKLEVQ